MSIKSIIFIGFTDSYGRDLSGPSMMEMSQRFFGWTSLTHTDDAQQALTLYCQMTLFEELDGR